MHLVKDENGNVISHGHEHTHEHTHDGVSHSHPHTHDHGHEDCHSHEHEQEGCGSNCGSCCGSKGCQDETTALLAYMLQHNEHHAAELDQMADNLEKLGMHAAAKTIKEGVSYFQKGNMHLGIALSLVKQEM